MSQHTTRTTAPPWPSGLPLRALLTTAALLAAASASAATPPMAAPLATTPAACEPSTQPPQSLDSLLAGLPRCEKSPNWLTALGERLLAQQRYAEAAEHLERALLLAPTHVPAAFAYSVALAGNGDLSSALQLLAQLATRPDVPPPLRQQLAQAQQRVIGLAGTNDETDNAAPRWQHRQSAGLRLGHDTNLMGTPRLSTLTLTLPGGDVSLPVEPSSLPRSGSYQRADVRTEHTHTALNGRRTELSAALLRRTSSAAPIANTTQAELALDTQPGPDTTRSPPLWATASVASLQTQGGLDYRNLGLGTGWAWSQPTCGQRLGVEWQQRQLLNNPVLSGRYSGTTASWGCAPAQTGWQPTHWQLSARLGTDHPTDPSRPGGPQQQLGLSATLRWTHWLAAIDTQRNRDTTGYSPILLNNTVRKTNTLTLRVEYHTPLTLWSLPLHALVGLEAHQQRANLEFFKLNSSGAYLSLRTRW